MMVSQTPSNRVFDKIHIGILPQVQAASLRTRTGPKYTRLQCLRNIIIITPLRDKSLSFEQRLNNNIIYNI